MIRRRELEKHAEASQVLKSTIDKDWVLGHMLDAIFSVPECREALVFKGGTCLRKCYFPDYRFSEDLDFTARTPGFELTRPLLRRIAGLVQERAEIPLHMQKVTPLASNNRPTGFSATLKFWGADHSRNQPPPPPERWTSSIKLEIILYEQLSFEVEEREVSHPYSDTLSAQPLGVPCYSLHEVLAEKLRSLIQRSYTAPRDYYDIWHLSTTVADLDWSAIVQAFHQKMDFKGLEFTGIDQMLNETNDKRLETAWQNSLGHQIPAAKLPEYKTVRQDLDHLLNRIF